MSKSVLQSCINKSQMKVHTSTFKDRSSVQKHVSRSQVVCRLSRCLRDTSWSLFAAGPKMISNESARRSKHWWISVNTVWRGRERDTDEKMFIRHKATGEREQQSRATVLMRARRNATTGLMVNLMILSFDSLSFVRKILAIDAEVIARASGVQAANARDQDGVQNVFHCGNASSGHVNANSSILITFAFLRRCRGWNDAFGWAA